MGLAKKKQCNMFPETGTWLNLSWRWNACWISAFRWLLFWIMHRGKNGESCCCYFWTSCYGNLRLWKCVIDPEKESLRPVDLPDSISLAIMCTDARWCNRHGGLMTSILERSSLCQFCTGVMRISGLIMIFELASKSHPGFKSDCGKSLWR